MPKYCISYEQAGQKIVHYVERMLAIPKSVAHRLIRKGTIRVNSKRVTPFSHIAEGDIIYLPASTNLEQNVVATPTAEINTMISPYILYENVDYIVLNKPAKLPVHNGTRHTDSIASRLATVYAGASFIPTLVHRLDKDTTGVLLIAKTHTMLTTLHKYWREHAVEKYYLAWVRGLWEKDRVSTLQDTLHRTTEHVIIGEEGTPVSITVRCMQHARSSSLLLIQLHTGKTHQIRAQLAHRGFPIIGESKYMNNPKKLDLCLHSVALSISDIVDCYCIPTHWKGTFQVSPHSVYTPQVCSSLLMNVSP